MTYEIKPTGSTQFVNNGINTTANAHTVGLIASGSGTTGRRWRMRYEFTVPVQMASVDVEFILSGGSGYERNLTVGITDDAQTIAPADATVTLESKTIRATLEKMLYPDRIYYLWLGYPGKYFDSWTCKEDKVTIIATAAASTLTAKAGTLGTAQTLTINRADAAFTHTIQYTTGSTSGTIATKTSAVNVNWTPPLSLASQNTTGKTLSCKLTLTTYSGSTVLGTSETTISLTIPSTTAPTVTAAYQPEESPFDGIYVQGKSKVKASYTAAGQHGASIKNYVTTVNGKATTHTAASFTSEVITSSGSISVAVKATDSRGYSTTKTETITVQPYAAPAVIPVSGQTSIVCARATADGVLNDSGTYLRIRAGKKFSSVSGKNKCLLRFRYAEEGQGLGSWSVLLDKGSGSNEISTTLNLNLDPTKAYTVEIGVSDEVGSSAAIAFSIATQDVPLHLGNGGKNIALGRYCDHSGEKRIDIGWEIYLAKGVRIHPPEGEKSEVIDGLGVMRIEKLWENASPGSDFSPQDIKVNIGEYDGIEILFDAFNGFRTSRQGYWMPGSENINLIATESDWSLGYGYFVSRRAGVTANNVNFGTCYASNNAAKNGRMIPLAIYGIKGVE